MLRKATFSDVPAMLDVLRWAHGKSIYAHLTLDEAEANRILVQAVQRNGARSPAGTFVQVAVHAGQVEGLIVGVLSPVYHIAKEIGATDLFWIATPRCPARDRVGLMLRLVDWAKAHPRCVEVTAAASDVMGGAVRARRILETIGFTACGSIYRMETA